MHPDGLIKEMPRERLGWAATGGLMTPMHVSFSRYSTDTRRNSAQASILNPRRKPSDRPMTPACVSPCCHGLDIWCLVPIGICPLDSGVTQLDAKGRSAAATKACAHPHLRCRYGLPAGRSVVVGWGCGTCMSRDAPRKDLWRRAEVVQLSCVGAKHGEGQAPHAGCWC